jgi:uncharacterized protein
MTKKPPTTPLEIELIQDLSRVPASEWNAGVDPNDPFTEHAFLALLEESGSVGREAGWLPVHLLAKESGKVVGSVPLYLKNNSYGEYIFDWGWAESAQRAGIPYYPKLVCAVPFTPATGRRILAVTPDVQSALLESMHGVADATGAQSIHILFMTASEHETVAEQSDWIPRTTHQFHWDNHGYTSFDQWLNRFRSKRRKEVKRERRIAAESDTTIRMLRGADLTPLHWERIAEFYRNTTMRKQAMAYLSPDFFKLAHTRLAHTALAFVAETEDRIVAASLCFQRGNHLYGRYWGCEPAYKALHFELCYHAPIEAAIAAGWTHFEAGAQGMHKLARGLAPARTFSTHHLRHKGLHQAVENSMVQEENHLHQELTWLGKQTPFHRNTTESK